MSARLRQGEAVDVVAVGSGVAGIVAALAAARTARVAVVTKGSLEDGCSRWAQGGIAAALGDDDSAQRHFEDTMQAGRGLCDPAAVRVLVEEGPARIADLVDLGVRFDVDQNGHLALGREAAHSRARIVHAGGDATGAALEAVLAARLRSANVMLFEHTTAAMLALDDAGRCCGVHVVAAGGERGLLRASAVILATGGASRLWRDSTNPASADGDGVALALQAGADVVSMEFEQFHPTALAVAGAPRHLITEAMRGEGAVVVDAEGRRFLLDADPMGELAGRDVVSRAMWEELQRSGASHVYLDCSAIASDVAARFPSVARVCAGLGIDIRHDRIPVAPAAHYTIGGVRTDLHGATNVAGLYACGEVAHTGVHGANRLASNSLLESLVFGQRTGASAVSDTAEMPPAQPRTHAALESKHADENSDRQMAVLRDAMWRGCGVVRDVQGLRTALAVCEEVAAAGERSADARLVRAALTASVACRSALRREETRGAHIRSDFVTTAPQWHGVLVMHNERRDDRVDHA